MCFLRMLLKRDFAPIDRTVHTSNVDKVKAAYTSKRNEVSLITCLANLLYRKISLLSFKN